MIVLYHANIPFLLILRYISSNNIIYPSIRSIQICLVSRFFLKNYFLYVPRINFDFWAFLWSHMHAIMTVYFLVIITIAFVFSAE